MSKLTKSPLHVARHALAVATSTLPLYAHRFSPKKFTQPQLFACLVLKTFFKTDYRGLTAHLADHSDLRATLALKAVPHFTTLQKASRRLLRLPKARRLFHATIRRFLKRRRKVVRAALDSTGLDCGHASRYYVRRRSATTKQWQTVTYSRYAKLEASFDCATHLMLGVLVGRGPIRTASCRCSTRPWRMSGSRRRWRTRATTPNRTTATRGRSVGCVPSSRRRRAVRRPSCRAGVTGVR